MLSTYREPMKKKKAMLDQKAAWSDILDFSILDTVLPPGEGLPVPSQCNGHVKRVCHGQMKKMASDFQELRFQWQK